MIPTAKFLCLYCRNLHFYCDFRFDWLSREVVVCLKEIQLSFSGLAFHAIIFHACIARCRVAVRKGETANEIVGEMRCNETCFVGVLEWRQLVACSLISWMVSWASTLIFLFMQIRRLGASRLGNCVLINFLQESRLRRLCDVSFQSFQHMFDELRYLLCLIRIFLLFLQLIPVIGHQSWEILLLTSRKRREISTKVFLR